MMALGGLDLATNILGCFRGGFAGVLEAKTMVRWDLIVVAGGRSLFGADAAVAGRIVMFAGRRCTRRGDMSRSILENNYSILGIDFINVNVESEF